jgi:hypothetical protein
MRARRRTSETCRKLIEERGWSLDPARIYVDDGASGALFGEARPSFHRMMNDILDGAKAKRLPFQVLVTKRLLFRGLDVYRPRRRRRVSGGRRLPRRRRGRRVPLQRSPVPGSPSGRSAICQRAALEAPATRATVAGGVDPA